MDDITTPVAQACVGVAGLLLVVAAANKVQTWRAAGRVTTTTTSLREHVSLEEDSLLDEVLTRAPEEATTPSAFTSCSQAEATNSLWDHVTTTATASPFEYELPWNGSSIQTSETTNLVETIQHAESWFRLLMFASFAFLLVSALLFSAKKKAKQTQEETVAQLRRKAAQTLEETRDEYNSKLEAAKDETKQVETRAQTVETSHKEISSKLAAAEEDIKKMTRDQSDLKKKMGVASTEAGKKILELEKLIEKMKGENSDVTSQLESLKSSTAQEKSSLEERLTDISSEKDTAGKEIDHLTASLRESKSETAAAIEEKSVLQTTANDLESENSGLATDLQDANETIASLRNEVKEANEKMDKANQDITGLKEDLKVSANEKMDLENRLRAAELESSNAARELSERQKESNKAIEESTRKTTDLKTKLDEANTKASNLEMQLAETRQVAGSEKELLENALEKANADRERLETELSESTKDFEWQKDVLEKQVIEAQDETGAVSAELMQKHWDAQCHYEAQIADLKTKLGTVSLEFQGLKSKHDMVVNIRDTYLTQKVALQETNGQLQTHNEELQKKIDILQAEKNALLEMKANSSSTSVSAGRLPGPSAQSQGRFPRFNADADAFVPHGSTQTFAIPAKPQMPPSGSMSPAAASFMPKGSSSAAKASTGDTERPFDPRWRTDKHFADLDRVKAWQPDRIEVWRRRGAPKGGNVKARKQRGKKNPKSRTGGDKKAPMYQRLFEGKKDDFLAVFHRRANRRHSFDSSRENEDAEWSDISYLPCGDRIEMAARHFPPTLAQYKADSWPILREWLAAKSQMKIP